MKLTTKPSFPIVFLFFWCVLPSACSKQSSPKISTSFEKGDDFKQLKKQKLDQLNSYGWIDQKNGIAHIPIERAIDLYIVLKGQKK